MDWRRKRLADYPAGYWMDLVCGRCRHGRTVAFADLLARLGPDATVADVEARARCVHVRHDPMTARPLPPCGGRGQATPRPALPAEAHTVTAPPVLPRWPEVD